MKVLRFVLVLLVLALSLVPAKSQALEPQRTYLPLIANHIEFEVVVLNGKAVDVPGSSIHYQGQLWNAMFLPVRVHLVIAGYLDNGLMVSMGTTDIDMVTGNSIYNFDVRMQDTWQLPALPDRYDTTIETTWLD